jgi:hypothetical protein
VKQIQSKIKKDCVEFNQLSVGSIAKATHQLYTKNRDFKELGGTAVETIQRIDGKFELRQ